MASVGAAVGLGNIFRFPYLAVKYGSAFIICYLLLLFLLGIPLLSCELAVGRHFKKSAVGCMKSASKKTGFVGGLAAANSFVIMSYYCLLFSFVLLCLVFSFRLINLPSSKGEKIFLNLIGSNGGFPVYSLLFLCAAWALVLLCFGSAERLGKISVYGVVSAFFCLLFTAVFLGLKNPSALTAFLHFSPRFFGSLTFWTDAASQVFFSLSVMVGVMFSYGAFLPKNCSISASVLLISFFDLAASILSTVIFAFVAPENDGGLLACFSVYPAAFCSVPGGFFLALLFYLSVAFLCLDSVFSYLKSITCAVEDFCGADQTKTATFVCLISFIFGVFMLISPFKAIAAADRFAATFLTLLIGVFESLVFGFVLKPKDILNEINRGSRLRLNGAVFRISVRYFCPASLLFLLLFELFS